MKHETGNKRKLLNYLFTLTLALTMLFGMTLTVAAADEKPLGEGKTVLAFTSDIHAGGTQGGVESTTATNRLAQWLSNEIADYGHIDLMGFCGDMGVASANTTSYWTLTGTVMDTVADKQLPGVYTTGNHECYSSNGNFNSTTNELKNKFVRNAKIDIDANEVYNMYCIGTNSWSGSDSYDSDQVTALETYLNAQIEKEDYKPIIILTHFPLHTYSSSSGSSWGMGGRTTGNADLMIDAINNAVTAAKEKGQDLDIVLLWGHNHTLSDQNYDEIFYPGDDLTYKSGSSKTLKFYYAAAGCMSDSENGTGSDYVKGKGLILTIDNTTKALDFHYYDENKNEVTDKVPYHTSGSGNTEPGDDDPDDDVTGYKYVETDELQSGHSYVVAADNGDGTVAAIQYKSSGSSSWYGGSSSVDSKKLTVADDEDTPYVSVGDSTVVWSYDSNNYLKNGDNYFYPTSSNGVMAYSSGRAIKFDDGLLSFESSSDGTFYLAYSGGSFATTNDSTKAATFRLFEKTNDVAPDPDPGTGGDTPGDQDNPPTGDKNVAITPTRDKPNATAHIERGETLVIEVTNAGSQEYTYTATSGTPSVAGITGGSSVKIGQNKVGYFTVEGVKDGTAEITITNGNGSSARTGIVTVTVGEGGGDTPPVVTSTRYEETDQFVLGEEYIIATGTGSSVTALRRVSNNSDIGSTSLTVQTSGSTNFIETNATDVVWTRENRNGAALLMNNGQMLFPTSSNGVMSYAPGSSNVPDRELTYTSTGRLSFEGSQQGSSLGNTYFVIYPVPSDNKAATTEANGTAFRLFKKTEKVEPTPAERGVTVSPTTLNLKVGDTAQLTATVKLADDEQLLDWNSTDISVADVSSLGKVEAVGEGTTTITVRIMGTDPEIKAECAVTVSKKDEGQGGDTPGGDTPGGDTPGGNTPGGNTPSGNTPSGNTPSGTTPGGTTPTKTDTNTTTTVDPKVQPTADQIAKAPVNSSLPVIDMDKIKTVASAKKATMTIGLGKMDADYCQIEYRKAGASAWTSAWVKPSNEVTLKNMKKKSYYQFRFTTFKVVNGKWEKSKTSNTSYRWILNTKVKKVKAKGKTATVTWAKVKGAKGYWVQYSTDKTFVKNAKVVKINKAKTTSKKIKGLKKGKTYYVRVRPVTKKSGKQYLGIYSGYKKFKVKKK